MEPLHFYGYMTLGAQHGHMEEVVVEEARLVHCILLTTEAEAGDSWGGPKLDCVPRGGQLRLGVTRHDKLVFRSVRTRRGRFELIINAEVGSSLDTTARG